ncbi:hypothetical protein N0V90_005216 [Kalmusia sp. IMI 367209]|nr:hypothetical protein N0V90_005216 [Kalmusia sp. IMI 367209]
MAPIASAITRVLITGFGPFQGVPNNPSWGIASRLPQTLPNDIELIVYPNAIPVAYHPVIETIPPLIEDVQPDISLHIGVAEGRTYFAVEQTSRKNVYSSIEDIDGEVFTNAEGDQYWSDQPAQIGTDLNLPAVVARWQNRTADIVWPDSASLNNELRANAVVPSSPIEVALREDVLKVETSDVHSLEGDDVRWSDNVGVYLCGFIYYTSMVEMSRETVGQRRDTAFMHVPMLSSEEELDMGVAITTELVQSLVETWRAQREGEDAS